MTQRLFGKVLREFARSILLWSCDLNEVSFTHSPISSRPCPSLRNQSAVNVDVNPFWCGMNKPSSLELSRFWIRIRIREGQFRFPRFLCPPEVLVLLQRYFLCLFSVCDPFAISPLPSRMHGKLGFPLISVAFCCGPALVSSVPSRLGCPPLH
jgi:hypothetical protein